jgi:hypothetical protein
MANTVSWHNEFLFYAKLPQIIGTKYLLLSKINIIFIEILFYNYERKF